MGAGTKGVGMRERSKELQTNKVPYVLDCEIIILVGSGAQKNDAYMRSREQERIFYKSVEVDQGEGENKLKM